MKKIIVTMIVVVFLAGCAGNSFLCKNKDAVLAGLQFTINQATIVIQSVQAQYPGVIPPFAQQIIDKAQQAKDAASAALTKACPTPEDNAQAQGKVTDAMQSAQAVGIKMSR